MKILHTSDWHLGRTFHGRALDEEHAAFIDHLVGVVRHEGMDAVLLSGDVYDRGVPPRESVRLLDEALARLSDLTRVVITPGNHDDARRLGFAASLMREPISIRAQIARVGNPVVIPDADGGAGAYVYALPYLHPDVACYELPPLLASALGEGAAEESTGTVDTTEVHEASDGQEDLFSALTSSVNAVSTGRKESAPPRLARSHEAAVSGALRLVAHDLASRRTQERARVPALVMSHAFVVGGASSESERDIHVGGVDSVPSEIFRTLGGSPVATRSGGLDYVALGHLHRPQEIRLPEPATAGDHPDPRLVYSGSPLAFSFDEAPWPKSSVLLEVDTEGLRRLERIPTPVPHPVVTVEGTITHLLARADEVPTGAWVRAIVSGPLLPGDTSRLREALGEVLSIQRVWTASPQRDSVTASRTAHPLEVGTSFLENVGDRPPSEAEREILSQAYEALTSAERGA